MLTQFFTIGFLMLLSAMLPGADFAMVTKNTLIYSRRAGIYTSLGVGTAILVHITYCALGLAIIISQSLLLFSIIKYIGATYLVYLGIKLLFARKHAHADLPSAQKNKKVMRDLIAFRQGFFCNLLNPKATLFFLALFTMIIKPDTPALWIVIYAIEMFIIITAWFCSVALLLSHHKVVKYLNKAISYIEKALGLLLIGFGAVLAFAEK